MRLFESIKNLKLGVKLNILAFLIFSLLLLGMSLATNNSLNSFIRQAGRQDIIQDAQTIQTRFGEIEQETLNNSTALSNIPGLSEALIAGNIQLIRSELLIASARLGFDDVDVVNLTGKRLFDVTGTGLKDEDRLFALALLGFDATGVVVTSEEEQAKISIAAVVPIHDASGATIGALFGSRIIDNEMLARVNIVSGQTLDLGLIVDGRILASDFESAKDLDSFSAHLLDLNSVEQALNGQTVVADQLITNSTGSPYALGYTPLTIGADTRAVIGLTVNLSELAAFQSQLVSNQRILFILIAIIGNVIFAFFASYSVATPIRRLQLAAEQLAKGNYTKRVFSTAKDEVGQLANSFDSMATQLSDLFNSMEQRITDRTKALATSTEVSRRISTILNRKELVTEVVAQVNNAFGYYHTQIYFYDEAGENLVMAGGTGLAGELMLAQFHKIGKGRGLVGRAAESNEPVLVSDTTQAPEWLPNPLLPDTKAEIAIPISIGDQVLGVLDVQHNIVNGLKREDIDALQSISNQVAVAVGNARSYDKVLEAEKLTRNVIDSTDDWIFIKDQDHRYQLVNQGYANSLHIPIADFIGKNDLELGFPEELVKGNPEKGIRGFWADDRSVMDGGVPKQIPDDLVTIDGNIHVFDTVKVPLRDADNKVWGVLAFARDMTERRNLEELNKRRAHREEAINLITQKIQNTISIESALQVAVREVGHALGTQTSVQLELSIDYRDPKTPVEV